MTASAYERRRAERERARQRSLMGETLAEFQGRERGEAPGAGIPKVRCERTVDMFTGLRSGSDQRDLFDEE